MSTLAIASEADWSSQFEVLDLGEVSFSAARSIQEDLVSEHLSGNCGDKLLFCEHPPTLSLGRRVSKAEEAEYRRTWRTFDAEIVRADRGGQATFHGPGQLVIYPLLSLKEHKLGVRRFVEQALEVIAATACEFGLMAKAKLCPAGVWVGEGGSVKKIAAAGLRIDNGLTLHGFSLNVSCDLGPYQRFAPCGLDSCSVSSISAERKFASAAISTREVARVLTRYWWDSFYLP